MVSRSISVSAVAIILSIGSAARAESPEVVATIKPIHSLVAGVMQGVGTPQLLIEGAGSPHSYSLRPSEAEALSHADIVFWVGEGMETFLPKALAALSPDAEVVELGTAEGVRLLPTREGGTWDEHADEDHGADTAQEHEEHGEHEDEHAEEHSEHHDEHAEEHGEHEGEHEEEAHAHGQFDMHIWLDPHNAEAIVEVVLATLVQADPENASAYRTNATRLREQLLQLDAALAEKLAPIGDRPFVVFHDAYQYFEDRYGLHAVGSITVGPDRRPGAQRLQAIRDKLEEVDAACVFAEPQFEPALVETVIEGTGANRGVLDPLGADIEAGPGQYGQLLSRLGDSLVGCLGAAKSG